ncbi:unnamed protein product [Staurois parvus]|uniref:Uncharacterized protein n=1 Tax=Staurois parvus TaxID=386267 RepID=A0ABN9BRN8_9NEOB|nr:unnamed protein product [Staurois parvus]
MQSGKYHSPGNCQTQTHPLVIARQRRVITPENMSLMLCIVLGDTVGNFCTWCILACADPANS